MKLSSHTTHQQAQSMYTNINSNSPPFIGTILIVDDIAFNLQVLMAILEPEGYHIKPVLNGKLALKVIKSSPPDLILLDINMPIMNGYEVCQKIKSDPDTQDIPVIFISTFEEAEYKLKAYEVGGCDYVSKPVLDVEVVKRVEHQMTIQALKRELNILRDSLNIEDDTRQEY